MSIQEKLRKISFLSAVISILLLGACQEVPAMNPDVNSTEQIMVTVEPEVTPEVPQEVTPELLPEATVTPKPMHAAEPEVTVKPETPEADRKSILGFLKIALQPVGKTMYVWGGGWNEEDTAAGVEAVTLGMSPAWEEFAAKQDASYDYNKTRYQIHDGLDCSGYVGWAVYNVLETENGKEGYVLSSTKMAENFANRGLGDYLPITEVSHWQAGDIVSMKGHVWIAVGMCEDGSVLLLHSSPPGVSFCGTKFADDSKSQAVLLAETIMQTYYPEWYEKYPECARPYSYLKGVGVMRWNRETLNDEEGITERSAEEVISLLFP